MAKDLGEIQEALRSKHFNGTSAYHQANLFVKAFIITDGILDYLQTAECFYMADKLATEMYDVLKTKVPDKYYLTCDILEPNGEMSLSLRDYNDRVIWSGGYERSTHPFGQMKTYIGWDGTHCIWCLPSED